MLTGSAPQVALDGAVLSGSVHGGQQPVAGAHIYLYAANTAGYNTTAATYASVSLLQAKTGVTVADGSGNYYVTSDANGNWSIGGDYTCTPDSTLYGQTVPGQQVYLYAVGGTQGGIANQAAGLMAVLGDCPAAGSFAATVPKVNINEVTTVAAAYAMAGFAYDATHVSSASTTLAETGVKNAFANAGNLVNIATGAAYTTTPGGNGTVPAATINTLANILAACVNTNGAVTGPANASNCYTLFNNARSGGSTGTVPAETATAAINIAHNPGNAVSTLYGLPSPTPPFGNALSSVTPPNDFTLAINFSTSGGAVSDLGIDAAGNAYGLAGGQVIEATPLGVGTVLNIGSAQLSYTSFQFSGGIYPVRLTVGNGLWITGIYNYNNYAATYNGSDQPGLPTGFSYYGPGVIQYFPPYPTPYGFNEPAQIDEFCELLDYSYPVVLGAGGVYSIYGYANGSTLSQSGSCSNPSYFNYVPYGASSQQPGVPSQIASGTNGLNSPSSVATTSKGAIWVDDYTGLSAFTGVSNTANSSYNAHTVAGAGGLTAPGLLAIDGNNNVWVSQSNSLVEFVTSGTYGTSGSFANTTGFTGGGLKNSNSIAIDGAGNVWLGGSALSEFNNAGKPLSPSTGYVPTGWSSVAIDGSGDVWGSSSSGMIEMIGAAVPVVTPVSAGAGTRP